MSKNSKVKSLRIIIMVVVAVVLASVYTLGGDKSEYDLSESISSADIATKDTVLHSYDLMDSDTESDIDTDLKHISNNASSENDQIYSDKEKSAETDTALDTDTDSGSKLDSENDSDEELEESRGTIYPYRGVWNLIVVNKDNSIPESYNFELVEFEGGKQVDSRIYDDLNQMFADMRAVGIYPVINEAYRTAEDQEEIMQNYISDYIADGFTEEQAQEEAEKWVAQPGTSEHQLGLAVDINADTNYSSNEAVYSWLANNAYKYGFILRYPQGKEKITGIDYEPWHYRYVGKIAAEQIYNSGECLEEYLKDD